MKKIAVSIIALLILSACNHKKPIVVENSELVTLKNVSGSSDAHVVEEKIEAPEANSKTVSKKIIKEGEISFETNNVITTRNAISSSLQKLGGYIAEENEVNNSDNGRKEYTLKTRIPAKSFDLFLNNVSGDAERIDSKNIRTKDVTTEYIDISTQLANKKKLEDRYLELLKRGDKIADLLQIENKVTEIQTDIESTQGQLNYLTKEIEYSSLDITFYSRQAVKDDGQGFGYKFKSALSGGWDTLGSLFFSFIGTWPIWIVVLALFLIIRARRRKINKTKNAINL